jgi:hypothetical protein
MLTGGAEEEKKAQEYEVNETVSPHNFFLSDACAEKGRHCLGALRSESSNAMLCRPVVWVGTSYGFGAADFTLALPFFQGYTQRLFKPCFLRRDCVHNE